MMNRVKKLTLLVGCVVALSCLVSCGTTRKSTSSSKHKKGEVTRVESLSPEMQRKYDYFFLEALRQKQKGNYDSAFDLYSHCLTINPQGAVTLYEIAKFYLFLNQPEKGEIALEQAAAADPTNFWYNQTLAGFYQGRGQLEKAITVLEEMSTRFTSRLEPLMALIELYTRSQDYPQVIRTLNRLEAIDGKSEQISMEKFRMYLSMNDMEQAFQEIEALAQEYPYDLRYKTILGDVYLNNGKEEEAYATYQTILAEEPTYAPAMLSVANYYEKTGQDSLYQNQIDTLLLSDGLDSEVKLNMMRQIIMQSEQGDKDSVKITSLFTKMLQREQSDANMAMLAAQYFLTKEMKPEATQTLHLVLKLDPENTPARLQLLSFALAEQNMEEVVKLCLPAMDYTPEVLEFYYYGGLGYYQLDKKDEALEIFKKGVNQVSDKADKHMVSDFYSIMGDLYHMKKMTAEAYQAYDAALSYRKDNIGALNNYAYYLSLEKKELDKAEEMSYQTVKAEPKNATYLDTYAWILFEKGKYTEAKIYIDQALLHGGRESSVVIEHCGDIYFLNGEKEKALSYWMEAEKKALEEGSSDARDEKEMKLLRKKIAYKKYFAE
ncbi:MAG: tetratricopeptide repeat protein [Phocaeicola sp.]